MWSRPQSSGREQFGPGYAGAFTVSTDLRMGEPGKPRAAARTRGLFRAPSSFRWPRRGLRSSHAQEPGVAPPAQQDLSFSLSATPEEFASRQGGVPAGLCRRSVGRHFPHNVGSHIIDSTPYPRPMPCGQQVEIDWGSSWCGSTVEAGCSSSTPAASLSDAATRLRQHRPGSRAGQQHRLRKGAASFL